MCSKGLSLYGMSGWISLRVQTLCHSFEAERFDRSFIEFSIESQNYNYWKNEARWCFPDDLYYAWRYFDGRKFSFHWLTFFVNNSPLQPNTTRMPHVFPKSWINGNSLGSVSISKNKWENIDICFSFELWHNKNKL